MNRRHLINGVVLAGILALAALVQHTAPSDDAWQAPMEVAGDVGAPVTGRNIEATVWGARAATEVRTDDWVGETTGVWVVVDVSAVAVVDEFSAALRTAQLVIGDETFGASSRPVVESMLNRWLSVGIPARGPLFFEIPEDALRDAQLQLAVSGDPRLDSLLVIPLDLAPLEIEPLIETDDIVWGSND